MKDKILIYEIDSVLLLFLVGFLSCNLPKSDNKKPNSDSKTFVNGTKQTVQKKSSLKEKILGIWGNKFSENTVFDIRRDSIYYVDQFQTYKYKLKDSTIIIFYLDYKDLSNISFVKDTLVLELNGEKSKFLKFTK